jgi:ABC-type transport system involved in Fe-S cluster assembly, permease component
VSEVADAPVSAMESYRFDFEDNDEKSSEPSWMRETRREAMGAFERLDFPTMKDEDWHFTNVAPIAEKMFGLPRKGAAVSEDVIKRLSFGQEWNTVVFVNGRFERIDVSAQNVAITSLADEIAKDSEVVKRHLSKLATPESASFTALNTALATDGAVIRIPADTKIEKPIHLLFISDSNAENTAIQTESDFCGASFGMHDHRKFRKRRQRELFHQFRHRSFRGGWRSAESLQASE